MQSSPIPAQQLKPATIKSPVTAVALSPGSSTSPRRDSAKLSSRSPNAHPALAGTLRMESFYNIDKSFKCLLDALKPDRKAAKSSVLPAVLDELQGAIKVSTLQAERAFTQRSYAACRLNLAAAKSNQVLMLGKIDSIAEENLSDDRRTRIRSACREIGAALSKMLIQATTMENAPEPEKGLKKEAHDNDNDNDNDGDAGPPAPALPTEPTPERHRNSPARSSQKRTQGDADSPVLAHSPGKRQKIDTATFKATTTNDGNASTSSTTAVTTATTSTIGQLPAYRPVALLDIKHLASGATSVGSPDKLETASSTSHASPRKIRTLSPQARPRPRSQLFVAPPGFTIFTSQVREDPADVVRTAALVQVPPGVTPGNAVAGAQSIADSSGPGS
jgi:hypothetical protein